MAKSAKFIRQSCRKAYNEIIESLEFVLSSSIDVNGVALETDQEGYLLNQSDWSEDFARSSASQDECELTENHWEVIQFLREYFEAYDVAPAIRILTKQIGKKLGKEKGNSKYLYELFPEGPAKQACKYAGLPKPTGCV